MIYSPWDIEQKILKLVTLCYFLFFYPPKNPQKRKVWKNKNFTGDIIILHMCTENHNIWCTVPEIRIETDIIVILGDFLHFYQPSSKNQNFEKKKEKKKNARRYYPFKHTCIP